MFFILILAGESEKGNKMKKYLVCTVLFAVMSILSFNFFLDTQSIQENLSSSTELKLAQILR